MSSEKNTTSVRKVEKKKKPKSKKVMAEVKCSTKRANTTLNWNQFLLEQNKDNTVKRPFNNNRKISGMHKVNCIQQKNTAPVDAEEKNLTNPKSTKKFSSAVAIDCEMVGIGDGRDNMLARVSIVDEDGNCLYDTFVKQMEPVIDYRTEVSGVRPVDMVNGKDFKLVQQEVYDIIKDKILVGHSISSDLKVLILSHPKRHIRDTSRYRPLRELNRGATPSLKILAKLVLNKVIQHGEHSSIEDAHATMQIYLKYRTNWEKDIKQKHY